MGNVLIPLNTDCAGMVKNCRRKGFRYVGIRRNPNEQYQCPLAELLWSHAPSPVQEFSSLQTEKDPKMFSDAKVRKEQMPATVNSPI